MGSSDKNEPQKAVKTDIPSFRKNPKAADKFTNLKFKSDNFYKWQESVKTKIPRTLRNMSLSSSQKFGAILLLTSALTWKALRNDSFAKLFAYYDP